MRAQTSFVADFLADLRSTRERAEASAVARSQIETRDRAARAIARELDAEPARAAIASLAARFEVPCEFLRSALALEIARCRVREQLARDEVVEAIR